MVMTMTMTLRQAIEYQWFILIGITLSIIIQSERAAITTTNSNNNYYLRKLQEIHSQNPSIIINQEEDLRQSLSIQTDDFVTKTDGHSRRSKIAAATATTAAITSFSHKPTTVYLEYVENDGIEEEGYVGGSHLMSPSVYDEQEASRRHNNNVNNVSHHHQLQHKNNNISSTTITISQQQQHRQRQRHQQNLTFINEELGVGYRLEKQLRIQESSYDYTPIKQWIPDNCIPQYDWQIQPPNPNCNNIHEQDLMSKSTLDQFSFVAEGGYRIVWKLQQQEQDQVFSFKSLYIKNRFKGGWTIRNYKRHEWDAIAYNRLTSAAGVINQYGYCGNTGIYDYATGGSLQDLVEDKQSFLQTYNISQRLNIAYQVSNAIADIHNIDKEGTPSIVHADINLSQFVSTAGTNQGGQLPTYKINDFNRARFLYKYNNESNIDDNTNVQYSSDICPFYVQNNAGIFRSPEEYRGAGETEKIDVYSMGNILYVLLTGKQPFDDEISKLIIKETATASTTSNNKKNGQQQQQVQIQNRDITMEIQQNITNGLRPLIPTEYIHSNDKQIQIFVKAIQLCWIQNPTERASARTIQHLLAEAM